MSKLLEFKGPFEHVISDPMDWPISRFYRDRKRIVEDLADKSFESIHEKYGKRLPDIIKQTIYSERIRVKNNPLKVDPQDEYEYWKRVGTELNDIATSSSENKDDEYQELCKKILRRYAEEIPGNFNPKTFAFARKLLTRMFGAIYNPWYKKDQNGMWFGKITEVLNKFKLTGPIEKIRGLFERTSVVVVPTHFSNLDSPLIGYGIETMTGMPAYSYGAGLNLYDYELAAYYMSRLGAYKVDRRKRNVLYLNTLKEFSTLSILKELNTVFWPGGTRSRSGEIEKTIKYGLLGTLIEAQNNYYSKGIDKKVMVLPLVVSYHFVFEADELIDQHLKKTGKEQYIPVKLEKKASTFHMLQRFLKSDSEVYLSFGEPMDVFGNVLDENGNSVCDGEIIDIRQHFISDNEISIDKQRNDVYTRILAEKIVTSYHTENVVLSSHLVTFCAFEIFKSLYKDLDIYSLLSLSPDVFSIPKEALLSIMKEVTKELKNLNEEGRVQLSPILYDESSDVLEDGLKHLNTFHINMPLFIEDDLVKSMNLRLLYYYHNRLNGYDLEESASTDALNILHNSSTF